MRKYHEVFMAGVSCYADAAIVDDDYVYMISPVWPAGHGQIHRRRHLERTAHLCRGFSCIPAPGLFPAGGHTNH